MGVRKDAFQPPGSLNRDNTLVSKRKRELTVKVSFLFLLGSSPHFLITPKILN
jgi:hypothetical protein